MFASMILAVALITTPPPPGNPEVECVRLYPGDWKKIVDCVSPEIDLEANPKLKQFFAACRAAADGARSEGVRLRSAVLVLDGQDYECDHSLED